MAWRELGERLIYGVYSGDMHIGDYPKLDEIERQHQPDDSRLRAVIECWLQDERMRVKPSWRALIWTLDDTKTPRAVADTIRHFAEPLSGKSCDSITFSYSVQVLPHIRVFIQTQGVCDDMYMYVDHYSLALHHGVR